MRSLYLYNLLVAVLVSALYQAVFSARAALPPVELETIPAVESKSECVVSEWRPVFDIRNESGLELDLSCLKRELMDSLRFYESVFGATADNAIKVVIERKLGSAGYSVKQGRLRFTCNDRFINCGLSARDVIRHEAFHALFCNQYPFTCVRQEDQMARWKQSILHEGLADYFSYSMDPEDTQFGENFRVGLGFIRQILPTYDLHLMAGKHGVGTAITSIFIRNRVEFAQIKAWMDDVESIDEFHPQDLLQSLGLNHHASRLPSNGEFIVDGLKASNVVPAEGIKFVIRITEAYRSAYGEPRFRWVRLGTVDSPLTGFIIETERVNRLQIVGRVMAVDSFDGKELFEFQILDRAGNIIGAQFGIFGTKKK